MKEKRGGRGAFLPSSSQGRKDIAFTTGQLQPCIEKEQGGLSNDRQRPQRIRMHQRIEKGIGMGEFMSWALGMPKVRKEKFRDGWKPEKPRIEDLRVIETDERILVGFDYQVGGKISAPKNLYLSRGKKSKEN